MAPPLTPLEVLRRARARALADAAALENYAWHEREIERGLTPSGAPGKVESDDTVAVSQVDGVEYQQLIARDGKPLSAREAAVQAHKSATFIRKHGGAARRAQDERERAKQQKQRRELIEALPRAFDLTFLPPASPPLCDCYVISMTPRPGFHATSSDVKFLRHMAGTMWVERGSFGMRRVEVRVLEPLSFGWVLARIEPGSSFVITEAPVDGHWFESGLTGVVRARLFLVKKLHLLLDDRYSNYQQFAVTTHVQVPTPGSDPR
ncbi:MAG: hypothetical protein ACRD1Y_05185 [Terriglobales bacterium]